MDLYDASYAYWGRLALSCRRWTRNYFQAKTRIIRVSVKIQVSKMRSANRRRMLKAPVMCCKSGASRNSMCKWPRYTMPTPQRRLHACKCVSEGAHPYHIDPTNCTEAHPMTNRIPEFVGFVHGVPGRNKVAEQATGAAAWCAHLTDSGNQLCSFVGAPEGPGPRTPSRTDKSAYVMCHRRINHMRMDIIKASRMTPEHMVASVCVSVIMNARSLLLSWSPPSTDRTNLPPLRAMPKPRPESTEGRGCTGCAETGRCRHTRKRS